jgi:hypothetical protein
MDRKDLIDAVGKYGLDHDAEAAVDAVFSAIRNAPTGVMVFREAKGRSVSPERRKTIFMCG